MTKLARLAPAVAADRLYPADAAYMARTDLHQTRLVGFTPADLDTVTARLMGLLNGRATVRHRCGVTDEILALFDAAGLPVAEDMRIYEQGEEAERHADALIEMGYKLFWPYPLREGRFPAKAHLVAPDVWRRLNDKRYLDRLVPPNNLAPRTICASERLAEQRFEKPVFLKAGGEAATAFGYAVRYCPDQADWLAAVDWFLGLGVEHVIIEQVVPVQTTWCATIVVEANQTSYAGAAEQIFAAPAKQSGSVIDQSTPFTEDGVRLAIGVGEAARKAGFVGIAGLDIGLSTGDKLIVFDPNFRINASSVQVLLHQSAAQRGAFSASCSVSVRTAQSFGAVLRKLQDPIKDGWFVPTRLIDGALLATSEGKSDCTGFVLGSDRARALARQRELTGMLGGPAD